MKKAMGNRTRDGSADDIPLVASNDSSMSSSSCISPQKLASTATAPCSDSSSMMWSSPSSLNSHVENDEFESPLLPQQQLHRRHQARFSSSQEAEAATPVFAGSRARDHLANERTFLAWVRTGLALFGASLGLLKWQDISNAVAYLVALLGTVVLLMATQRYFAVQRDLERHQFQPNVGGILFVVTVTVLSLITAFALHETNQLYHHSTDSRAEETL